MSNEFGFRVDLDVVVGLRVDLGLLVVLVGLGLPVVLDGLGFTGAAWVENWRLGLVPLVTKVVGYKNKIKN